MFTLLVGSYRFRLKTQLISVFTVKLVIGQVKEFALPYISRICAKWSYRRAVESKIHEHSHDYEQNTGDGSPCREHDEINVKVKQWERDAILPQAQELRYEYQEMAIQFGYMVCTLLLCLQASPYSARSGALI